MNDWVCSAAFGDLRGFDDIETGTTAKDALVRGGDEQIAVATFMNSAPAHPSARPTPLGSATRHANDVNELRSAGGSVYLDDGGLLSLADGEPQIAYPAFADGTELRIRSDGRSELLADGRPPTSILHDLNEKERRTTLRIQMALLVAGSFGSAPGASGGSRPAMASLHGSEDKMWAPGRPLRVAFPPNTSQMTADAILEVARMWTQNANVALVDADNHHGSPLGYPAAEIRIWFDVERNASLIGGTGTRLSLYRPTMMLSDLDKKDPNSDDFRRVVLHEFGHALGLLHEHQSPDADFNWQLDEILAYAAQHWGWNANDVARNITTPAAEDEVVWSLYDESSIMHYKIPSDWVTPEKVYNLTTTLSDIDLAFARAMYPFPDDPAMIIDLTIGQMRPGMLERQTAQVYRTVSVDGAKQTGFKILLGTLDARVDLLDDVGNTLDEASGNNELSVAATVSPGSTLFAWVSRTGSAGGVDYQIEAFG